MVLPLLMYIDSTHCGALAYSAIHASKKGYICMSFTHADSLMLTHNSIDTFLEQIRFVFRLLEK